MLVRASSLKRETASGMDSSNTVDHRNVCRTIQIPSDVVCEHAHSVIYVVQIPYFHPFRTNILARLANSNMLTRAKLKARFSSEVLLSTIFIK